MDHGNTGHGGTGHGGMGHGGMGEMCSMNVGAPFLSFPDNPLNPSRGQMLFTWDTRNLCIIFRQWHVRGIPSLILSLLAIVALTAGYELVRDVSRRYEARCAEDVGSLPRRGVRGGIPEKGKLGRAALYAVQVFYSFFIMLLFMTYNGWVMLSVAVGAFVGYLVFGSSSSTKSVACH
ncbi:MAG: hypothetical protein M1832_001827 [Thelocarpon impressellum]|nr:MAG: hypothetical protein M1832_001827 [Thelocarpon impressellum]